jgi:hypothetical protein
VIAVTNIALYDQFCFRTTSTGNTAPSAYSHQHHTSHRASHCAGTKFLLSAKQEAPKSTPSHSSESAKLPSNPKNEAPRPPVVRQPIGNEGLLPTSRNIHGKIKYRLIQLLKTFESLHPSISLHGLAQEYTNPLHLRIHLLPSTPLLLPSNAHSNGIPKDKGKSATGTLK